MPTLPSWLSAALAEHAHERAPASADLNDLAPGDIWVVRPAGNPAPPLRRLALILDTDEARGTIHISLLTNETEMATDHDLVLGPEQTGCSFALVAQTRLLGRLYWSQAVSRIGAIEDPLLDAILDFIWEEHRDDIEHLRGRPVPDVLAGMRRSFERSELSALRQLAEEADPTLGSGRASLCLLDVASLPQLLAASGRPTLDLLRRFAADSRNVHFCRSDQVHDPKPAPSSANYPAWGPGTHELLEAFAFLAAAASRELLTLHTTTLIASPSSPASRIRVRCGAGLISQLGPDQPVNLLTADEAWPSNESIGRLTGDATLLEGEHVVFVQPAVAR